MLRQLVGLLQGGKGRLAGNTFRDMHFDKREFMYVWSMDGPIDMASHSPHLSSYAYLISSRAVLGVGLPANQGSRCTSSFPN